MCVFCEYQPIEVGTIASQKLTAGALEKRNVDALPDIVHEYGVLNMRMFPRNITTLEHKSPTPPVVL